MAIHELRFQLVRREFVLFWENKVLVIAFLVIPLLLASVLGFVYREGNVTRLPILVVDKDNTPASSKLVDILAENNTLHVIKIKAETVNLTHLMIEKNAVAVVIIPYRFEANCLLNRHPEINCYLNLANTLTGGTAGSAIQQTVSSLNASIQIISLEKKGLPFSIAKQKFEAFHHNVFQQYNPAGNYLFFLWPGLIFAILHQLVLMGTAIGFSQEFANNTFNKTGLLKFSQSPSKLIFVKIFPYLCLSLFTVFIFFLLSLCFDLPSHTDSGTLLLSSFLMIIGTCMLGTFFSIVSALPLKVSQTMVSIASPAFTLSGFTWPSEQMPFILQSIADSIPLTPFLRILRLTLTEGASLEQIMPHIIHQAVLVVAYFLLGFFLLKKKINNEVSSPGLVPIISGKS